MAQTLDRNHTDQVADISTGEPVPVSIDSADARLTQLWYDVAEEAQARGGTSVTMAQVLNLIVRAGADEAAGEYQKDIEAVTGSHPARVFRIVSDPTGEESPLQAWVNIHCKLPPAGGRQVCAEQITIQAGGSAARQIPAAVIPLLRQELPVFLWWPSGSPFDDYVFRHLADSLNRLIVDSSTFENPEGSLGKMALRLKGTWPNIACTDTNWERLTRWRELVAQFFDGASLRPYLDRISDVTIEYMLDARQSVNRAQALLLAGWLSTRLGWQAVPPVYEMLRPEDKLPPAARLSLISGGRPVSITLQPSKQVSDVPGELSLVRLVVRGDDPEGTPDAKFEAAWSEDDDCAWLDISVEGANPSRRNVHLEKMTRAELLDVELEVFSHDRIYEEALEMAYHFIRGTATAQEPSPRKLSTGEPMSAGAHRTRPPEARGR